jgi:hypothetical protein
MTQTPGSAGGEAPCSGRTLRVYGYEMTIPDGEHPLPEIRGVIARENRAARRSGRNWTARLVVRPRGLQVLVVSSSPDAARERNPRLEAGLTALGVDLVPLLPMPITQL